jgi:hypothetical protein
VSDANSIRQHLYRTVFGSVFVSAEGAQHSIGSLGQPPQENSGFPMCSAEGAIHSRLSSNIIGSTAALNRPFSVTKFL